MQRDKIARSPLNRQSRTTTPPTNHGGARYRADLPIQRSLTIVNPFRNAIIPRRGNFSWRAVDNFRESSLKKKKEKRTYSTSIIERRTKLLGVFNCATFDTFFFFFFFWFEGFCHHVFRKNFFKSKWNLIW